MTSSEKLRVFIDRVKGEHVAGTSPWCRLCGAVHPCSALRAVLALGEMLGLSEMARHLPSYRKALARAAQKLE